MISLQHADPKNADGNSHVASTWHTTLCIRIHFTSSRPLPLRNLVAGYECGRAFPAGVKPGSPSRDAANWLPSRFGLSVETRRRYGWLRMVFPGVRPFRAPIWWPSGGGRHARGREHFRGEPGSALSVRWVRIRFGEDGGQLDRRRARGVLNPCAREPKAQTGRFLRGKLISDHGLFSSYEGQHRAAKEQDSRGFFRDAQGFGRLDAGSRARFTWSRPPPPWTSVFQLSLFL